jgi:hypothetical protein
MKTVLIQLLVLINAVYGRPYWSWISGTLSTDLADRTGNGNSYPSAREHAVTWIDSNTNRLFIFGGKFVVTYDNFTYLNDLWRYDPELDRWDLLSAAMTLIPIARFRAVAWQVEGGVYIFGGRGYANNSLVPSEGAAMADMWFYSNQLNSWNYIGGSTIPVAPDYGTLAVESASSTPGSRFGAYGWKFAGKSELILFGGDTVEPYVEGKTDLWTFNVASNLWTWVHGPSTGNEVGVYGTKGVGSPSNQPGFRRFAGSAVFQNTAFLYGGFDDNNAPDLHLDDLWKLSFDNGWVWTWIAGAPGRSSSIGSSYSNRGVYSQSNTPGARFMHYLWADPNGLLFLFGGVQGCDDLWTFNTSTLMWAWISGNSIDNCSSVTQSTGPRKSPNFSNSPGANRTNYQYWIDKRGRFYSFGGALAEYENTADLWSLCSWSNSNIYTFSCFYCSPGKFTDLYTPFSCYACDEGKFSLGVLASTCTSCSAGSFSLRGNSSCHDCSAGKFSSTEASFCSDCLVGRFSASPYTICNICTPGKFSSPSRTSCENCLNGTYSSGSTSFCLSCESGTYSDLSSSACFTCPKGRATSVKNSSTCTVCPSGSFADASRSSCSSCPAGKYSTGGAWNCISCDRGTYSKWENSSYCNTCTLGTWSFVGSPTCDLTGVYCVGMNCISALGIASAFYVVIVIIVFITFRCPLPASLLILISLADFAGDIAYLLSAAYFNNILFALSIIFIFGHLTYSIAYELFIFKRKAGYFEMYSKFFKMFLIQKQGWKKFKGIFSSNDSLTKMMINALFYLLYVIFISVVAIFSSILALICITKLPELILALVLVPTKMIGLKKIKKFRNQVVLFCGSIENNQRNADNLEDALGIDHSTLGRLVLLEQISESIPQFLIQVINTYLIQEPPNTFGWIKLIFSAYLAISGAYSYFYHRVYMKKNWEDVPVGLLIQMIEKINRRNSQNLPTIPSSAAAPSEPTAIEIVSSPSPPTAETKNQN